MTTKEEEEEKTSFYAHIRDENSPDNHHQL